jgi:hypothetical protein
VSRNSWSVEGCRVGLVRRMGAEWVVDEEVVVTAMKWCAWSDEKEVGACSRKTPSRGGLWPLGDGPVAAFDQAGAGDGGGGD